MELTALNGTGYKGACNYADSNTGEIRITGENMETQVWNQRGGAGSQARIIVEARIAPIRITSHRDGERVTSRVITLAGEADPSGGDEITVQFADVEQTARLASGVFQSAVVLRSGPNAIRACQGTNCSAITVSADIARLGLMATLSWSGGGDLDLHVQTPGDQHCYFSTTSIAGACELDIDDQRGENPENMSIPAEGDRGQYRFWVVNYDGGRGSRGQLSIYKDGSLIESASFTVDVGNGETVVTRNVGL